MSSVRWTRGLSCGMSIWSRSFRTILWQKVGVSIRHFPHLGLLCSLKIAWEALYSSREVGPTSVGPKVPQETEGRRCSCISSRYPIPCPRVPCLPHPGPDGRRLRRRAFLGSAFSEEPPLLQVSPMPIFSFRSPPAAGDEGLSAAARGPLTLALCFKLVIFWAHHFLFLKCQWLSAVIPHNSPALSISSKPVQYQRHCVSQCLPAMSQPSPPTTSESLCSGATAPGGTVRTSQPVLGSSLPTSCWVVQL